MSRQAPSPSGSGGRLKARPAPELVASANELEVSYGTVLSRGMGLADLAHTVTLVEAGIIPREAAPSLLSALLAVYRGEAPLVAYDPALGDAYKNREHHLATLAPDTAGWLRTGRARREATNLAFQIAVRERLLALADSLNGLAEALVQQAASHVDTVMPDFTYLQPAQPTSLAHYLLSFVFPMGRDGERLQACFGRVNRCSGGIGSVNGSRLPFRRQRLAELLGFDGVVTNTRDAMWQADLPIEILACAVAAIVSLDRLGEDLQVWATEEFNLVELADAYCRESVIMPQKKNPYSLAFVRGAAGVLIGELTSMANVGRTLSGQPDSRIFAYGAVPRSLELAIKTARLMTGVVRTLSVNVAKMARRAAEGYSQATDLAEMIMLETGIPYLQAHRVVAEVVAVAAQKGIPASGISARMINAAARKVLGCSLRFSGRSLGRELQPRQIVATRTGLGGAARKPLRAMILQARASIAAMRRWKAEEERQLGHAETHLIERAEKLSARARSLGKPPARQARAASPPSVETAKR